MDLIQSLFSSVAENLSASSDLLVQMNWVRPRFLYLLPILLIILFLGWQRIKRSNRWEKIVDPHLLQFLLKQGQSKTRWFSTIAACIALALLIVSLAGPSFKEQPVPLVRTEHARVILLDLSYSMDAMDIKPSRLTRAKHKLLDILAQASESETGLIVYAGDAYIISPLTSDTNTIANLVPILETGMMPLFGSDPIHAVDKAKELLINAGKLSGEILWITDGISDSDADMIIESLIETDYFLSVLMVGTEQGAPIPLANNQGFLKNELGDIVMPSLRKSTFLRLSQALPSFMVEITADDSDIEQLLDDKQHYKNTEKQDLKHKQKLDQGYWVLFLVIPFILLLFRKNARIPGATIGLLMIIAVPETHASWWDDLWKTPDQQAQSAIKNNDVEKASELFEDPSWKASAHYKAGNFDQAEQLFSKSDDAVSHFNRGNALAHKGDFENAIKSYESALQNESDFEDAKFNRDLVTQLLEQQKQEQEKNQQDQDNENENKEQQQNQSGSEQKDQQDSEENEQSEETNKEQSEQQEQKEKQQSEKTEDERSEQEKDQALEQWLRKIPDDPSGLLRRKMIREYKKRGKENRYVKEVW